MVPDLARDDGVVAQLPGADAVPRQCRDGGDPGPGQRALGGGTYLGDTTPDDQDAIIRSAPVNSTGGTGFTLLQPGQTANAWYGEAFNAGTNGATVRVYVICAA